MGGLYALPPAHGSRRRRGGRNPRVGSADEGAQRARPPADPKQEDPKNEAEITFRPARLATRCRPGAAHGAAAGARAEEDAGNYEQSGETIEIDDSGPECGLGWELDVDTGGEYICVCSDPFWCDDEGGSGGGGGNDGGGGSGGGSGECTDGSCTCEQEDPEPEFCELPSCMQCDAEADACDSAVAEAVTACEESNLAIAERVCKLRLLGAPDITTCIEWQINGTPALGGTVATTSGSSQTDGYSGGVQWPWGSFDVSTSTTESSSITTGTSSTTPHSPPNRDLYEDCADLLMDGVGECYAETVEC